MSFSTDVKEELSKLSNLADKTCVKAEMYGYLCSNNVSEDKSCIRFSTESEYNINRFSKLLNNLNIIKYDINIVGKNYNIVISKEGSIILRELYKEYELEDKENIKKAFIRGVFLGSGTINNPKNKYHLEIIFRKMEFAQTSIEILKEFGIALKILNTSERYSLYTKDGEEISKFLAFIGASSSVLKFEEIRVYRDMRNNINRIVNCETANLSKTVNAAVKQIEAINKLKENGKFAKLPDTLKELAELRVENPESSLTELGKILKSPIGKSGVNHRLQAILKIAEEE
mgnify:FL=1